MKLLSIMLFIIQVHAIDLNYFNNSFHKELHKDEQMFIRVTDRNDEKLFIFRWTLFHNKGLVTLSNYDGHPSQHLLTKKYQENSIKFSLASRVNETSRYHPYLLINFLGYNYETKRAKFEILHKDPSGLTAVELQK